MVTFDLFIGGGDASFISNKNLGKAELNEVRLLLLHENFTKEIYYNEIENISINKKTIITLTLKDGSVYKLADSHFQQSIQAQHKKNWERYDKILYDYLMEQWKQTEKLT